MKSRSNNPVASLGAVNGGTGPDVPKAPHDFGRYAARFSALPPMTRATQRVAMGFAWNHEVQAGLEDEPVLPPQGKGLVKLALKGRTDDGLAAFGESHAAAMTGNARFPKPFPSAAQFDGSLAEYEQSMTTLANHQLMAKSLTAQLAASRAAFEKLFQQRRDYVQMVSNGNAAAIASAGLAVCRQRSAIGVLPAPKGLRLAITKLSGELLVRWDSVAKAKYYTLEMAEYVPGEPLVWSPARMGGKRSFLAKNLVPGRHYAFRVATIGGKDGVSPWGLMVEKMSP